MTVHFTGFQDNPERRAERMARRQGSNAFTCAEYEGMRARAWLEEAAALMRDAAANDPEGTG